MTKQKANRSRAHHVAFMLGVLCLLGAPSAPDQDAFAWLENNDSKAVRDWVQTNNDATTRTLQNTRTFRADYEDARAVLALESSFVAPRFYGNRVYRFSFENNARAGRMSWMPVDAWLRGEINWQLAFDVDEISQVEQRRLTFKGMNCIDPAAERCLIFLSDGGKDAVEIKEFDPSLLQIRSDGFNIPEGKQRAVWLSTDEIAVARDWGPGSLTAAGQPFIVKVLRRGQLLASAREVARGAPSDVLAYPIALHDERGDLAALVLARATSSGENIFESVAVAKEGQRRLPLPPFSTLVGLLGNNLVASLDRDWVDPSGRKVTGGAIISINLAAMGNSAEADPSILWEPTSDQALTGLLFTKSKIIVTYIDNMRGRAASIQFDGREWRKDAIALPDNSTITLFSSSRSSNLAILLIEGFTKPRTLWLYDGDQDRVTMVESSPSLFDSQNLFVDQRFARSPDGTLVPYFVVGDKRYMGKGPRPTLLYGYGGFQSKSLPEYLRMVGPLWLDRGYNYVVANIRGGGEYGAKWHDMGRGRGKLKSWADFLAVANALAETGVTEACQLGVTGTSQGGLLAGVAFTQWPNHINAAVMKLPLLDMLNFHRLGRGAIWVEEYGDPNAPKDRRVLAQYSPYANLNASPGFPPLIITNANDDRAHPAHGRKFAARLQSLDTSMYYYENLEGGHVFGASLDNYAYLSALEFSYLTTRLAAPTAQDGAECQKAPHANG